MSKIGDYIIEQEEKGNLVYNEQLCQYVKVGNE